MQTRDDVRTRTAADPLEELWELPSASEPAPGGRRRSLPPEPRFLARGIFWGWMFVLVTGIAFAPTPNPDAVYPWYSAIALELWVAAGVGAWALFSADLRRLAYVVGTLAGAHGIVVGIACRQTGHHMGSWWIYETVAFAALTAASLTGVLLARR